MEERVETDVNTEYRLKVVARAEDLCAVGVDLSPFTTAADETSHRNQHPYTALTPQ